MVTAHGTSALIQVLANDSDADIIDPVISCDYLDREGTSHGRGKWVIYDRLDTGEHHDYTIRDKRYVSHRAREDSIVCRIVVDAGSVLLASHAAAPDSAHH